MSDKIRNKALAILLISFIGCLFTGEVLVNAQAEESTPLEERVARIEGILEQMSERLLELNHLGSRIDGLSIQINSLNTDLGDRIEGIHSDINSWNTNLIIAFFAAIILTPITTAASKRYIDKD